MSACKRCGIVDLHTSNERLFGCGSFINGDGDEYVSPHCQTRVALRGAIAALNDLADAAAPMVDDKPATTRDYVELNEARKRALKVLEVQPCS